MYDSLQDCDKQLCLCLWHLGYVNEYYPFYRPFTNLLIPESEVSEFNDDLSLADEDPVQHPYVLETSAPIAPPNANFWPQISNDETFRKSMALSIEDDVPVPSGNPCLVPLPCENCTLKESTHYDA